MAHATTVVGEPQERRTRRYDIAQPVRFRSPDGAWADGVTVNMSAAGVLIRTRQAPPPSTRLEFEIAISGDVHVGSRIGCSGHVLRTEAAAAGDCLMAVTIDNFQLRRASGADEDAQTIDEPRRI